MPSWHFKNRLNDDESNCVLPSYNKPIDKMLKRNLIDILNLKKKRPSGLIPVSQKYKQRVQYNSIFIYIILQLLVSNNIRKRKYKQKETHNPRIALSITTIEKKMKTLLQPITGPTVKEWLVGASDSLLLGPPLPSLSIRAVPQSVTQHSQGTYFPLSLTGIPSLQRDSL